MSVYKHLLLAVGLNEHDERLGDKAIQLAEDFSARLSLVHVIEECDRAKMHHARNQLEILGKRLIVPKFDQRLVVGSITETILTVADRLMVDAVIVGRYNNTHSSDKLMKQIFCDVIQVAI